MNKNVLQIKALIEQLELSYNKDRVNQELDFLNTNNDISQVVLDLILIKKDYFEEYNILLVKGAYSNLYIFYLFDLILTNPLDISSNFNILFNKKIILKTNNVKYLKQCIKLKKNYEQVVVDKFRPLSQSIEITTSQYPEFIYEKYENHDYELIQGENQIFDYTRFLNHVNFFKANILRLYNDYLLFLNKPAFEEKGNYILNFIIKVKDEDENVKSFFNTYPQFDKLLMAYIKEPIGIIELNRLYYNKNEENNYLKEQQIYKKEISQDDIVVILTEDDKLNFFSKYLFNNKQTFKQIKINEYKPEFYESFLNYSLKINKKDPESINWIEKKHKNINDYNLSEVLRIYLYENYEDFEKEIPESMIKLFNNVPIYIEDIQKIIKNPNEILNYYKNYEKVFDSNESLFLKKYLAYNRIIFKNENLQELELYYMLFYYTYVIKKHSALAILNYFE